MFDIKTTYIIKNVLKSTDKKHWVIHLTFPKNLIDIEFLAELKIPINTKVKPKAGQLLLIQTIMVELPDLILLKTSITINDIVYLSVEQVL